VGGGGGGGFHSELQPHYSAWQLVSEQMQALGEHFLENQSVRISILIQKRRIQYVSLYSVG
jgi:hypothetical protein